MNRTTGGADTYCTNALFVYSCFATHTSLSSWFVLVMLDKDRNARFLHRPFWFFLNFN
ncbi:hypothetical protein [Lacticaseibacillus paracasei]|nr:hypothetical protein [Lacticaseibacillus paracasei]MBM6452694.1 hypothetical protein [Lacticaseibacillus paracasei]MCO7166079.1 hypothetical protein [Lacticaseibacillus paracasei]MCP9309971.1 hypothetical protein [Lacticaseibacillus paracasei]